MKKQTYSDKLKSPKWQKKRLKIMDRDNFTCQKCGDTETQLHVHHKKYIDGKEPWDYEDSLLITLCDNCHFIIESCIKALPDKFDISKIDIYKAINDGFKIEIINYNHKGIIMVMTDLNGYEMKFYFNKEQTDNLIKYLQK